VPGNPVLTWLLEGDPAIRWQAMRDLKCVSEPVWLRERRRVAREGWGARLLAFEDASGRWANGVYSPKWTSTTYSMLLLRAFGLSPRHPAALRACAVLFDAGFWRDGGINFYARSYRNSETCVSAMVLSLASWFAFDDPRVDQLAEHVIRQQMADGGWNCRAMPGYAGATHGSFHTTISALEALLDYQRFRPGCAKPASEAQARGREFLLIHRMYRSHRTGAVANSVFTRFSFPPRWHYDVLRGLDYFRDSRADRDPRLEDAIQLVIRRRPADGRWLLPQGYPGRVFFELERPGQPSRWNTLRALRVLRWWQGG
jgi:hypothetical protein